MAAPSRLRANGPRLGGARPLTDRQGLGVARCGAAGGRCPLEPVVAPMLVEGPFPLASSDIASETKESTADGGSTWHTQSLLPCLHRSVVMKYF